MIELEVSVYFKSPLAGSPNACHDADWDLRVRWNIILYHVVDKLIT